MVNKGVQAAGVAAVGAAGYYLYTAGGNPKVAEKQFEGRCCHLSIPDCQLTAVVIADISKASAKVKSEIPGRENQAQKDAEKWSAEAKAKADTVVSGGRWLLFPPYQYYTSLSVYTRTQTRFSSLTATKTRTDLWHSAD